MTPAQKLASLVLVIAAGIVTHQSALRPLQKHLQEVCRWKYDERS